MPLDTAGEARAYPRSLPNPEWLGKLKEEILEPDLPIVDKGACGYPVLFNAFKRLAHGASASEKADLFAGTASRFYRLGNPIGGYG